MAPPRGTMVKKGVLYKALGNRSRGKIVRLLEYLDDEDRWWVEDIVTGRKSRVSHRNLATQARWTPAGKEEPTKVRKQEVYEFNVPDRRNGRLRRVRVLDRKGPNYWTVMDVRTERIFDVHRELFGRSTPGYYVLVEEAPPPVRKRRRNRKQ